MSKPASMSADRDRVDEQLEPQRRAARVARQLRDDGGEVAAGGVARDRHPARVGAELGGVLRGPLRRRPRVVDGGRELRLRRQPVADVQHDRARRVGQRAADRVVRLVRAEQPAAAVEVDDEAEALARRSAGTSAPGSCRLRRGSRGRPSRPRPRPAGGPRTAPRSWPAPARREGGARSGRPEATKSSSIFCATGSSGTGFLR